MADSKTINKLLVAINEVIQIVDTNDFINHLQAYKNTYKKTTSQDILIQQIIKLTCDSIGIPERNILHTKNSYCGKRVMAYGIIGMFIKIYIPHLSLQSICNELNNNVKRTNLQIYIKKYKNFAPNEKLKEDTETAKKIEDINYKILNFIKDEKLR